MTQPVRFAVFFAIALACAGAAFADPYRVRDLAVDKVAPSSQEALQQGRNEAALVGAQRLIERLTLPEDRSQHEALDPAVVARFAKNSETQGESKTFAVAGGIRATGTITYIFKPEDMRDYLKSKGMPFVDTQAAKVVIIPVGVQGVDPNAWGAQWHDVTVANGQQQITGKLDDTVLTPYVGSIESWQRRPGWSDVQGELSAQGADHGVIVEAYSQAGQIYVRLVDLRAGVTGANLVAGPFPDLATAKAGAIAELERAWKVASIVRTSGSTNMALIASFKDIGEWVRIKRALDGSRLISGLNVESLSISGADVSFAFAGRPEQLTADLRSRGIDLHNADNMWVVQVATAQ